MKADNGSVVALHYRVVDESGETTDDSRRRGVPMYVLLGRGMLFPALEQALLEHEAGDHVQAVLTPEQAFGERRDDQIQRVPKKYFQHPARLKPGMATSLSLREGGQRPVTVHKVGMSTIDVDTNHPLAGQTVTFEVDLIEVREATPEELAHGHAHPPGAQH
ncbi:MAG TPA: peptidylprolyl isomerase [Rhodanobacteraceae bacterium]|nr:peptidylprolyl isomerase [Rhodanobacteraceae bacterium]